MILPGKHLHEDRALLGVGGEILKQLAEPRTVSELWERVRAERTTATAPLSFDWFVLALTLLYSVTAIDMRDGVISWSRRP